jgi:hypothetical protein
VDGQQFLQGKFRTNFTRSHAVGESLIRHIQDQTGAGIISLHLRVGNMAHEDRLPQH